MNIGLMAVDSVYPNLASWADKKQVFRTCEFEDFEPRKGFKCKEYFNKNKLVCYELRSKK